MKILFAASLLFLLNINSFAQPKLLQFTHADTLRGTLSPERSCYDVTFYDLNLRVDVVTKSISGFNIIRYKAKNTFSKMQVDLFSNMKIDSIISSGKKLSYLRDGNAVFIVFEEPQFQGAENTVTVYYNGKPQEAANPPWDGGFVWRKDPDGKDWIGVACEGTGASLWWPCKDYIGDKPDSMNMTFTVPSGLWCVSNGQLRNKRDNSDSTATWRWAVTYPVNNYNITFNLTDYVFFSDTYIGIEHRPLALRYFVLRGGEEKAKQHFAQVKLMLACYEKYFGPYPFYRDGYALVESSYWGMEHQSAIAYGNHFKNNKFGFDFIIIHESGHEWWGNSVSCSDLADMWIHESFTTYSEALYIECRKGYDSAVAYLVHQRWNIKDKHPLIGPYGVNFQGTENDNDIYYKGSWMLHTFRNALRNDSLFFAMLKGLYQRFALKTTNTEEVIAYINQAAGADYTWFFNQYLRYANPPVLQYYLKKKGKNLEVRYKWKTDVPDFIMPVKVVSVSAYSYGKTIKQYILIHPNTSSWQTILIPKLKIKDFDLDTDAFYVRKEEMKKI